MRSRRCLILSCLFLCSICIAFSQELENLILLSHFKNWEAIDLNATCGIFSKIKLLGLWNDKVPYLFVINLKKRYFNLKVVNLTLFSWTHSWLSWLALHAFKHIIYRVVHQSRLIFISDHRMRLSRSCNSIGKYRGIIPSKHNFRHILNNRVVNFPVRAFLTEYHIKVIISFVVLAWEGTGLLLGVEGGTIIAILTITLCW